MADMTPPPPAGGPPPPLPRAPSPKPPLPPCSPGCSCPRHLPTEETSVLQGISFIEGIITPHKSLPPSRPPAVSPSLPSPTPRVFPPAPRERKRKPPDYQSSIVHTCQRWEQRMFGGKKTGDAPVPIHDGVLRAVVEAILAEKLDLVVDTCGLREGLLPGEEPVTREEGKEVQSRLASYHAWFNEMIDKTGRLSEAFSINRLAENPPSPVRVPPPLLYSSDEDEDEGSTGAPTRDPPTATSQERSLSVTARVIKASVNSWSPRGWPASGQRKRKNTRHHSALILVPRSDTASTKGETTTAAVMKAFMHSISRSLERPNNVVYVDVGDCSGIVRNYVREFRRMMEVTKAVLRRKKRAREEEGSTNDGPGGGAGSSGGGDALGGKEG